MCRALVGFIVLWVFQFAYAEELISTDVPLYRGAEIVQQEILTDVEWYLSLAKYRKINGVWQFSKALDLHGNVTKTTYLIQTHDLYQSIANFYQRWSKQGQLQLLFDCKNRSCGSSNEWANGHFKVRNLYGLEGKQRYWALKTATGYIAMYLVERGNGKVYLQVEEFKIPKK